MNYKTSKKHSTRPEPFPKGFEVTVYGVKNADRPSAMTWVFAKFENVVKIAFAD